MGVELRVVGLGPGVVGEPAPGFEGEVVFVD